MKGHHAMSETPNFLERFFSAAIRFLLPILLILSSVWVILQGAALWVPIEYRMPGFPADPYGFTLDDRLYWSSIDIEYLLNDEEISYFDTYRLDSGEPMHNARELSHMEDVKELILITWRILGWGWIGLVVVSIALGLRLGWARVFEQLDAAARGTIWLMVFLVLGLILAFGVLFVGFHRIFFEGDTWLFSYSDTFIRLYPERFWRDTFALVAITTLLLSWIARWLSKNLKRLLH